MMFDVLCRFRDSTTNTIRGFNRQLRKVTKSKTVFSSDDSLIKMLYLAMMDITKKWTGHRQDWGQIHSQLEIFFEVLPIVTNDISYISFYRLHKI